MKTSDYTKTISDDLKEREKYTQTVAWAKPSKSTIPEMIAFIGDDAVLEIGAGLGYWASLLSKEGVKIIATDIFETSNWKHFGSPLYFEIEKLSHTKAIKKYKTNCLFLCWPPYDTPMAFESLSAFTGDKLIYIGEDWGGCTGDYKFHDLLGAEWTLVKTASVVQFFGIHDRCFFYTRKSKKLKRSIEF